MKELTKKAEVSMDIRDESYKGYSIEHQDDGSYAIIDEGKILEYADSVVSAKKMIDTPDYLK